MAHQDEVDAACVAIAGRGERPTVDRVRTELGSGSFSSLTPQVRAWKEAQRAAPTTGAVQEEARTTDPAVLPPQVQTVVETALATLTTVAATLGGLAPAFAAATAGAAEIERRRTRLEVEGIEAGAAARVAEAMAAAEDERANTDLVRTEVSERENEIAALTAAQLEAAGAAAAVQKRLETEKAALAGELDDERGLLRAERAAAKQAAEDAAAEARRLQDEITDLGGKVAAGMKAAEEARVAASGARSLAQAATEEAGRLREQLAEAATKMEAVRTDAAARVDVARDEVAALQVRVAVAEKGEQAEGQRAARAEAEIERLRLEAAKATVTPPMEQPVAADEVPHVAAAKKRSAA
jgi:chromosome segregation ATPase